LFAGGILALILSIMLYKKAVPWVIRKIRNGSKKQPEIAEANNEENMEESVD